MAGLTKAKKLVEGLLGTTHKEAQENATRLLGLPPDNTAMDRAKALGFDTDTTYYHGTNKDFKEINPMFFGSGSGGQGAKKGFWMTDDPVTAGSYADYVSLDKPVNDLIEEADGVRMQGKSMVYHNKADKLEQKAEELEQKLRKEPLNNQTILQFLLQKNNTLTKNAKGEKYLDYMSDKNGIENAFLNKAISDKKNAVVIKNLSDTADWSAYRPSTHAVVLNPSAIRSKFAAFDPMKLGIGAGSVMSADLLAKEKEYGALSAPEINPLLEKILKPVKYASNAYKWTGDNIGLLNNVLPYKEMGNALDYIATPDSMPMKPSYGRLPTTPTNDALINLMSLLGL